MLRYKFTRASTVAAALGLAALVGGCGSSLTSGDSSGSLLDLLSSLDVSSDTTLRELLDQVTVGDVASTAASLNLSASSPLADSVASADLTAEQIAELEALQMQLDSGGITPGEFQTAVHDLLGDQAPLGPPPGSRGHHGRPGGPWGHGPGGPPMLDLTEEQQQSADAVFEQERTDVDALRSAAREQIRVQLTEEQLATLDALPQPRGHGDLLFGPPGPPPPDAPDAALPDWLVTELGLSADQQAAIDAILLQLQTDTQARHEQAISDFHALLTEEQVAELDELAPDDAPTEQWRPTGHRARRPAPLVLLGALRQTAKPAAWRASRK